MSCHERGDKVWWWSDVGGVERRTPAVFLEHDGRAKGGYKRDVFLAIRLGSGSQTFRWPARLTAPFDELSAPSRQKPDRSRRSGAKKRRKKPR